MSRVRHLSRALFLVCVVAFSTACGGDEGSNDVQIGVLADTAEATYEYLVPLGTGVRLDGGEVIELMPAALEVRVGESIRIVNDDTRDYMVGPFFVRAGQRLGMRFTHPGTLSGDCEFGVEGQFVINVSE